MLRNARWMMCLSPMLLAGCAMGHSDPPVVATPDLYVYSPAFQDRAAKEMTGSPPCDRLVLTNDCSAVNRLVKDYERVRDKIRAVK